MEVFCSKCLTVNKDKNQRCYNCGEILSNTTSELKNNRIRLADFWIRLLAFIIDLFIILLLWNLLSFVVMNLLSLSNFDIEPDILKLIFYIVAIIMMGAYNVIMETSKRQATIGKQIFKLTVGDAEGNALSLGQVIRRTLAKLVTCLTLGVGYILILFNKEKQAIHDILVNTYVFKEL